MITSEHFDFYKILFNLLIPCFSDSNIAGSFSNIKTVINFKTHILRQNGKLGHRSKPYYKKGN